MHTSDLQSKPPISVYIQLLGGRCSSHTPHAIRRCYGYEAYRPIQSAIVMPGASFRLHVNPPNSSARSFILCKAILLPSAACRGASSTVSQLPPLVQVASGPFIAKAALVWLYQTVKAGVLCQALLHCLPLFPTVFDLWPVIFTCSLAGRVPAPRPAASAVAAPLQPPAALCQLWSLCHCCYGRCALGQLTAVRRQLPRRRCNRCVLS